MLNSHFAINLICVRPFIQVDANIETLNANIDSIKLDRKCDQNCIRVHAVKMAHMRDTQAINQEQCHNAQVVLQTEMRSLTGDITRSIHDAKDEIMAVHGNQDQVHATQEVIRAEMHCLAGDLNSAIHNSKTELQDGILALHGEIEFNKHMIEHQFRHIEAMLNELMSKKQNDRSETSTDIAA